MAPAKGCPMPHSRFCSASEKAKTSRPQPLACDIGVRKNPSAERGPNDTIEIRQPQIATSATLRAVTAGRIRSAMDISIVSLSVLCCCPRSSTSWTRPPPASYVNQFCDRPVCHILTNAYRSVTKSRGEIDGSPSCEGARQPPGGRARFHAGKGGPRAHSRGRGRAVLSRRRARSRRRCRDRARRRQQDEPLSQLRVQGRADHRLSRGPEPPVLVLVGQGDGASRGQSAPAALEPVRGVAGAGDSQRLSWLRVRQYRDRAERPLPSGPTRRD